MLFFVVVGLLNILIKRNLLEFYIRESRIHVGFETYEIPSNSDIQQHEFSKVSLFGMMMFRYFDIFLLLTSNCFI